MSLEAKPPWRPKVAGRIAFWFGPIAGALVVIISLRRMGHPKRASKVMRLALVFAAAEAVILFFIPDALAGLVGLGAEIAFLLFFPVYMEKEFDEWQATHAGINPANGWRALGWGLVGIVLFFVLIFLVVFVLAMVFPHVL